MPIEPGVNITADGDIFFVVSRIVNAIGTHFFGLLFILGDELFFSCGAQCLVPAY